MPARDWRSLTIPDLVKAAEVAGLVFVRAGDPPIVHYRVTPPIRADTAIAVAEIESRLSEIREFADRYQLWAVRMEGVTHGNQ